MEQNQDHPDFKAQRKKRILKRVIWVVVSWILFALTFFYLPLPKGMKRSFTGPECEQNGGHWDADHQRCKL
jgi:hypothetical protein